MKLLRWIAVLSMLVALSGFGMFFVGLIGLMSEGNGDRSGPPPLIIYGFGTAGGGVLLFIATRMIQYFFYGPAMTHRGIRN
ncbi:hypothetical protein ABZ330_33515 [Streptomyces sp. NPDC006172]|uniref:hypothetical protein n=1 Tax=Streptomyces sp. NPDC006172 TaxID=3154470 RepID=UPI00340616D7